MKYIFKTKGQYIGFIHNNFVFSYDGSYLGWIDSNNVWNSSGSYAGVLIQVNNNSDSFYILKNKFTINPIPKIPKVNPIPVTPPSPRLSINPIIPPIGWDDAF